MDNLELAPIGWQLFILGNYESDSTAFPLLLDTYATRLLAEPLRRSQDRESARADRGEGELVYLPPYSPDLKWDEKAEIKLH
jgi:hypothetical protein